MKTSAAGEAFIAREEGEVLHVYKDAAGLDTIGVGHRLRPGEAYPDGITHDGAMSLLAGDLGTAEAEVNRDVTVPIGQNSFDALVSFAFNCGTGALRESMLHRLVNEGAAPENITAAFEMWDKRRDPKSGALVVDAGLLNRRKAEAALFLTPDAPADRPTLPDITVETSDPAAGGDGPAAA